MVTRRYRKAGFTFVELMLVLSIVMIITAFSYYAYQPYHDKRHLDAFMEQFEKDVLYAQMCALARNKTTYVIFMNGFYRIRMTMDEPIILDRYFDENIAIQFLNTAMENRIIFNNKGNIQKSGKVEVSYKSQKYTLVFQLGKGRFYYE